MAIIEAVLADRNENLMLSSFDMQMLVNTSGRERTEAEWRSLAAAAGLRIEAIHPSRSLWRLILLRRAKE